MELKQCWIQYQKAEKLMERGQLPEAFSLFKLVLDHLPAHVHSAVENRGTRPCQFVCLLGGITDAAIAQSKILESLGRQQQAFDTLNQNYALMQFLSLEQSDLVNATIQVIESNGETLLKHMEAFCAQQRCAKWMLEFNEIQKAHYHFNALKPSSYWTPSARH